MNAQPVAAMPTDTPPPRAADSIAAATNDFAQLLSDAAAPATDATSTAGTATATSGTNSTGSASTANTTSSGTSTTAGNTTGRTTKKTDDSASTPTILVVALQLQQQTPAPKTQPADPAPTTAASTTDPKVAAPVLPTTTAPITDPNYPAMAAAANAGANAGNTAPRPDPVAAASAAPSLPPGAVDMNARITLGPPSYFSQPNVMLTGTPRSATATPNDATGTDDDADASSVDAATTTGISAKVTVPANFSLPLQWHDSTGGDATTATPSDPGVASDPSAAPASDATSFSLPLSSDSQTAAPLSTATVAATTAPNLAPPPVYEQVAFSLRQAADGDGGLNTINIQLKPASLGAIQVKLDVGHDGKISAVISADRSDTLNLLRQDSQGLEQALRDAGLKADSGSLSFNLRGEQQSFAQTASSGASAPISTSQAGPSNSGAPIPRYSRHAGALDIEV